MEFVNSGVTQIKPSRLHDWLLTGTGASKEPENLMCFDSTFSRCCFDAAFSTHIAEEHRTTKSKLSCKETSDCRTQYPNLRSGRLNSTSQVTEYHVLL